MQILVCGAAGQLGSELQHLAPKNPSFRFVFTDAGELDITDSESVNAYFEKHKPDFCINAAAYTQVDKAETDAELAGKINRNGAENLALAAKKHGCRLFHISTDFVFEGTKNRPYFPEDPARPLSVYGKTKAEGEQAVLSADNSAVIVRTAWLYSSFGANFVKTMRRLGRERDTLGVVADQIGTPTYARNLAKALPELIGKSAEVPGGIYHFSDEGAASWYDFAQAIFDLSGISVNLQAIRTEDYPTPAARPAYSLMDKGKIKPFLSGPLPHWRSALAECIKEMNSAEA